MAKDIREIVEKEYPHFAESVQSLTIDQLEDRLVKNSKEREQVNRAYSLDKEDMSDKGLGLLIERKKNAEAPYKDALKALKIYDKFVLKLIEEKGGNIEVESSTGEED
jgi:hypothetical protein